MEEDLKSYEYSYRVESRQNNVIEQKDLRLKNILNKKLKIVRDDILLGEIDIGVKKQFQTTQDNKNCNNYIKQDFRYNNIILQNMLKAHNLKITNEKRKQIV